MSSSLVSSSESSPGGFESSTLAWVGPFGVFAAWLAIDSSLPIANPAKELLRDAVLLVAIVGFSRHIFPTRAPYWLASVALGIAVFGLWIAPDTLFPAWREHWLFQNPVTGHLKTSIPPAELTPLMLVLRTARAALLVPVLEELFWRGWLARYLQDTQFFKIPLGHFTRFAFMATAVLFALEHGPYWEVGLLCGLIYNWWMWRTRSLGDLMLVHGVTNLALSLYVISSGRWSFWG